MEAHAEIGVSHRPRPTQGFGVLDIDLSPVALEVKSDDAIDPVRDPKSSSAPPLGSLLSTVRVDPFRWNPRLNPRVVDTWADTWAGPAKLAMRATANGLKEIVRCMCHPWFRVSDPLNKRTGGQTGSARANMMSGTAQGYRTVPAKASRPRALRWPTRLPSAGNPGPRPLRRRIQP